MWQSLQQRYRSALRFRLLALVLLPLAAAMAASLGYTLYWFHGYTQDSLNVALRDHMAATRQGLRQFQIDRQTELLQLAESTQLRTLIRNHDGAAIQRTLQRLRDAKGYAFLHLTGVAGEWLYESTDKQRTSKPSPLTDRAGRGYAGAAFEVFREEDLLRESRALVDRARISLRASDGAEDRGLVLRLVQPIVDDLGRVVMTLDGGVLMNRNHVELFSISERVFATASLPARADPLVILLLDNVRIAASGTNWNSLLGTRLAEREPRAGAKGDISIGREQVLGDTYVCAYGTLYDIEGQPIGLLQLGVRETAFRADYYRYAGLLLGLFMLATVVAAWIAVRGMRTVFKPVEKMAAVVRATQAGENRRIGPIGRHDEIGELARQFDAMLDLLAARNREIQRAAAALEMKVTERTQELADKNAQLQQTIVLLERTQEQLLLADKLSALGKMAAGIAHEINNPAAVILGNLDVLAVELGPAAKPVATELELIAQQVGRIQHIVASLLQFARARPGVGPIADITVNRLVEDVLPLVAHVLKDKTIALHTEFSTDGVVAVNAYDLEQVLINLIANAANACEAGGVIRVTTSDDGGNGSIISVCDTGRGIPHDDIKRIFDPFFSSDPRRGAGLGLSVSYGLVQRYGGRITVESTVGIGSVFHVWLPRHTRLPTRAEQLDRDQFNEAHYG
ncbi:MAG TPA: ATP-binding protein [Burkholderiales bacterium]